MKRPLIALILFFLILFLCLLASYNAMQMAEDTVEALKELQERIRSEDFSSALSIGRRLQESWEKRHLILCTYMAHDRLEEIDQSISAMLPLIEYQESGHILSECDRIIAQVRYLRESERFHLENIL